MFPFFRLHGLSADNADKWDKSVFVKKNLLETERPGFLSAGHPFVSARHRNNMSGNMFADKFDLYQGGHRKVMQISIWLALRDPRPNPGLVLVSFSCSW